MNHKANPLAVDITGNTAMHIAVMNRCIEMVRLLDQNGANATVKNSDGLSAIEMAQNEKEIKLHFMS